ncbi:MAG TPA: glycoside hydrolase family 2 TIM barrel-domain containing protein [Chloroflexota bacterium]|nr:glycoside hydrolase family 2 TIM barrel-domain containing protein [Chloroflexota bacterium]
MTTTPAQQWAGVFVVLCGLLVIGGTGAAAQVTLGRVDVALAQGWKFHKGDVLGAQAEALDDAGWEAIALPHTWNNLDGQMGGDRYYRGPSWYRLHYTVSTASGRRFYLQFDGANLVTDAYVNGTLLGEHKGGFAAFRFDATSALHATGEQVIAVRVDNELDPDTPPLSADFTFSGGLYRMVHLVSTEDLHLSLTDFGSSAVYLQTSNVSAGSADLQVTAKVVNDGPGSRQPTLETTLVDASGQAVQQPRSDVDIPGGSERDVVQATTIARPNLWDGLAAPYLYQVRVRVLDSDGRPVDEVTQPLGFRSFSVDADTGFQLNGRPYRLYGVNKHQDRLDTGWAVSDANLDEDWTLVKDIGATAVRLAHYQHAQRTYDLADQGGQIIWAELPVINYITDSAEFANNARQQLTELIRQNVNHPSIAFWSISNEATLSRGPDPRPLLQSLNTLVHQEDPSRLTTHASAGETPDVATDVFGSNRYFGWYYGSDTDFGPWADRTHAAHPDWRLGISEYGAGASVLPSFHADAPTAQDHTETYQNRFHEAYWLAIRDRPYLWGSFVWNLFDFASAARSEGDTPGRNDKGLVTYDRKIRKDAFYWYQANWSASPVIYITDRRFEPRPDGSLTVTVYSNADSVDLAVNGDDLGSQTSTTRIFRWPVVLGAGSNVVEAIGTRGLPGSERFTDRVTWTVGGPAAPTPQAQ